MFWRGYERVSRGMFGGVESTPQGELGFINFSSPERGLCFANKRFIFWQFKDTTLDKRFGGSLKMETDYQYIFSVLSKIFRLFYYTALASFQN